MTILVIAKREVSKELMIPTAFISWYSASLGGDVPDRQMFCSMFHSFVVRASPALSPTALGPKLSIIRLKVGYIEHAQQILKSRLRRVLSEEVVAEVDLTDCSFTPFCGFP